MVMGIFTKSEKKVIQSLKEKCEEIGKEITTEIESLLLDLNEEYHKNETIVEEFEDVLVDIKSKLTPEENQKLAHFSLRLVKIKSCAKKGVETVREISRDQKKATRETIREHIEYLNV
jgi:translation initiation factor 2 alpha subunit (eIF-2alpha)